MNLVDRIQMVGKEGQGPDSRTQVTEEAATTFGPSLHAYLGHFLSEATRPHGTPQNFSLANVSFNTITLLFVVVLYV